MLSLALFIGGGGSRYGVNNAIVQIVCFGLLVWYWRVALYNWRLLSRSLRVLIALTLCLPLLQLVPLPPAIWQSLPGRTAIFDSFALLNAQERWFPWTFARGRTVMAFASLIPPLAILLLFNPDTKTSDRVGIILITVVTLGILSFLIGAIQIVSAGASPLPYPILVEGRLYGLFASHNTSGLFFVVAFISLLGLGYGSATGASAFMPKLFVGGMMVLGVLLTQSRSSIFLVCLVLLAVLGLAAHRLNKSAIKDWIIRRKLLTFILSVNFGLALVVAFVFLSSQRISSSLSRFSDLTDIRPFIWSDTIVAIREFFPIGTGMGSFDEVFQAYESLENVHVAFARRAHNDYLELGLEAGIFGWALLIGWFLWCARQMWNNRGAGRHLVVLPAVGVVVAIALQSGLDYPLRNQGMLAVMGATIANLGYVHKMRSFAKKN